MKHLVLQNNVITKIDQYILAYVDLFYEMYNDTGLFGLDQILENYSREGDKRRQEISDLIEQRFSPDIVLGRTPMDTLLVPWRTKVLWISWRDEGDTRIITDIRIR